MLIVTWVVALMVLYLVGLLKFGVQRIPINHVGVPTIFGARMRTLPMFANAQPVGEGLQINWWPGGSFKKQDISPQPFSEGVENIWTETMPVAQQNGRAVGGRSFLQAEPVNLTATLEGEWRIFDATTAAGIDRETLKKLVLSAVNDAFRARFTRQDIKTALDAGQQDRILQDMSAPLNGGQDSQGNNFDGVLTQWGVYMHALFLKPLKFEDESVEQAFQSPAKERAQAEGELIESLLDRKEALIHTGAQFGIIGDPDLPEEENAKQIVLAVAAELAKLGTPAEGERTKRMNEAYQYYLTLFTKQRAEREIGVLGGTRNLRVMRGDTGRVKQPGERRR